MNVFAVIGPEGSGTTWLSSVVIQHPHIDIVHHVSYPTNTPEGEDQLVVSPPTGGVLVMNPSGKRRWPKLSKLVAPSVPALIVVRDPSCAVASGRRRGFDEMEPRGDPVEALRRIKTDVAHRPHAYCSYETLCLVGPVYLSRCMESLGFEPFDFVLSVRDGNRKYFQGEA